MYRKPSAFTPILICTAIFAGEPPIELRTELVASGLGLPVDVTYAPGQPDRLYVTNQPGIVRVIERGVLLPQQFLNLTALITSGGERGFGSLAFHPDYPTDRRIFVNYVEHTNETVLAQYQVAEDLSTADLESAVELIRVPNIGPLAHYGGKIAFGPNDGYLYYSRGDGQGAVFSQMGDSFLGKIVRIDVDGAAPYQIPPDNPYVGDPTHLDEIWAKGLRNPWRMAFDRLTGDLFISDVGGNMFEEINYIPGTSTGGVNFGWELWEGPQCLSTPSECDEIGQTPAIASYANPPKAQASAITGYAYRGLTMPSLQGHYFYTDAYRNLFRSFRMVDGVPQDEIDWQEALTIPGSSAGVVSFGEDADGELYMAHRETSSLHKIVPDCDLTDITAHPQDQTVDFGGTALFTFSSSPATPISSFQWQKNMQDIPGATSPVLNIPSVSLDDAGMYRIVLGNSCGLIASYSATLSVNPAENGDFDGDGDVDLVDFSNFQICYTGSPCDGIGLECSAADMDHYDCVDLVDFGLFQLAFTGAQ
jgi:hypothetical protein